MTFTPWREKSEVATGPFDGVPDHLERPLEDWIGSFLVDAAAIRIALTLRLPLASNERQARALRNEAIGDEDLTLELIDLMLKDRREHFFEFLRHFTDSSIRALDDILTRGGSLWTVTPELDGLTRRVSPELKAMLEKAVESSTPASEYLRTAWAATYGLNPNPDHAYAESIRAVEDAAGKVVTPKDERFQLNKVAKALRDQKAQFEVTLNLEADSQSEPVEVIVTMMEWLIRANTARHSQPSGEPLRHSESEAEMAVQLAVLLVEWFEGGYIRRLTSEVAS